MHYLLLPAVVLLLTTAEAYTASCSNATCGGQTISYPFWLANSGPNCGYPGLGISCQDNTPILDHQFHQYRVLRIDYANRTVALADADAWNTTCPRLTFNLSPDPNSWLQLTRSNSNLTVLYNCKAKLPRPSAVKLDGCPDQSDTWYVTGKAYGHGCEKAVTTPVLLSSAHRLVASPSLGEVLSAGFEMRYDAKSEQCGACERSGGRCRYGRIEEHGGTEFACVCDDGANERQCGDAQSLRLKRQKICFDTFFVVVLVGGAYVLGVGFFVNRWGPKADCIRLCHVSKIGATRHTILHIWTSYYYCQWTEELNVKER
ncbi:hypothetical protein QYE76_054667 [Lolium multiflorum]|uniref:Wall-associated receptor kinase galacturonan-binding domain-containing protein n=1 Tax=Lolium multiflorum TaxID=4521 RepID=A0AAD8SY52_LOLMU|nr:hypothetical protein QYE76_054667 [Lolium multiflorum]